MGSYADRLRANMTMLYQFKEAEFNNILTYLVEQEKIQPGLATALAQDFQRRQSSIKDRRNALARLRQSGLEADANLLTEIEKMKGEMSVARARNITEVSVARAGLEDTFRENLSSANTDGAVAFGRAVETRDAKTKREVAIVGGTGDFEQDVTNSAVDYVESIHLGAIEGLGGDSVAAAVYKEKLDGDLREAIENRASQSGQSVDVDKVVEAVYAQTGLSAIQDAATTRQEKQEDFEEVKSELQAGGIRTPSEAKLLALGFTQEQADKVFGKQEVDPKLVSAAYYARYLPQFQEEFLDTGETLAAFEDRLEGGDDEANRLYDHVLGLGAADINLLSEGQYPYELYQISQAEQKLRTDREAAEDFTEQGRERKDYEDIYQEARQIYSNLFKRRPTAGQKRQLEGRLEADPEMRQAVAQVAEEDPSNFQSAITPNIARSIASAHRDDMIVMDESGQNLATPDGAPITTFEMLFEATGGNENPEGREAMVRLAKVIQSSPKNVNRQSAILNQYARTISGMTPDQREAATQDRFPSAPPVAPQAQAPQAQPKPTDLQLLDAGVLNQVAQTGGAQAGSAIASGIGTQILTTLTPMTNEQLKQLGEQGYDGWIEAAGMEDVLTAEMKNSLKEVASQGPLTQQALDTILGDINKDPTSIMQGQAFFNSIKP